MSGTTCQDKPNLCFSQPHYCAFGSPPAVLFLLAVPAGPTWFDPWSSGVTGIRQRQSA
jgi:hypothetical protein